MFRLNFDGDPFKKLRETVQNMASQSINIDSALAPLAEKMKEIQGSINITPLSLNLNLEKYSALFEAIAEETKNIPSRVDTINSYLAKRGWFVPFHFADLDVFKRYEALINEGKHEFIESDIQKYIREHIHVFRRQSEEYFPVRYKIISSAFDAHEEKKYELSIPVLLAQADGIFEELVGTTFYSNDEKKLKKIKKNLLKRLRENGHPASTTSFGYLLLKQLQEESLLHENYTEIEKLKEQDPNLKPLNRNTILHGRDVDYASEANSLRSISLIGLLCNCKDSFKI